jgi:hypothetical protein
MSGMMAMMASNMKGGAVIVSGGGGGGGGGGALATGGTVVSLSGYKVHIFNSSGTFATTSSWPSGRTIEYLVVAGGGGSNNYGDGGAGAGGLLTASGTTIAGSTNYAVTVGAGGGASTNGGDSSLIGGAISIVSKGGGGSGSINGNGQNGGSGAGGSWVGNGGTNYAGGKGVYPGSTYIDAPRQGYDGESGSNGKKTYAGAGGGASSAGSGFDAGPGGSGYSGDGLVSSMVSFYSASSIEVPPYPLYGSSPNASNYIYTFTVDAGLPFQVGSAVYLTHSANPLKAMYGQVNSYSGTTLVCQLGRYSNSTTVYPNGITETLSGWNIYFAHAGGGSYTDETSTQSFVRLGGGGGYDDVMKTSGLPNSGGGGYNAPYESGGSGVVMIKYAYP